MKENNQTTEIATIEAVENKPVAEVVKPYEFRKLCAKDIPLMMKIITKIGLHKFTTLLQNKDLIKLFSGNNSEEENEVEKEEVEEKAEKDEKVNPILVGGTIILDAAQIVLEGLGDCEEIFEMLSNVSGKKIEEIEALEIDVLMEMIIDFIKKEEFVGFFKAVLKLIK